MKQSFLLILASCSMLLLYGQGTLQINGGATLKTTNSAFLILDNLHFVNNGSFQQGSNGTVKFIGNADVNISGNSIITIDRLQLSKTSGSKLHLQSNLAIVSEVNFQGGLLDLGNNNIDLNGTGVLIGESELSRAFATGVGYIQTTAVLNAPSSKNLGNLGAIITSAANLGSTIIRRGNVAQTGMNTSSGNSIQRYFEITPINNSALNATLRFQYFDAELNGLSETSLNIWKSASATIGFSTRDAASNYVEKKAIPNFSQMTLADCPNIAASIPDMYAVKPGGSVNTLYIGYGPASLTLSAQVSGGTSPYTYSWTAGSPNGTVIGTGASLTLGLPNPLPAPSTGATSSTTYYLKVTDKYGCNTTNVTTKTVTTVDVRCNAPKYDKVSVYEFQNGQCASNCINSNKVASYLNNSFQLGVCMGMPAATTKIEQKAKEFLHTDNKFSVIAMPNPSNHDFTIRVSSDSDVGKVILKVIDVNGRNIEQRSFDATQTLHIGDRYSQGVYFVELQQGSNKAKIKLIKLAN